MRLRARCGGRDAGDRGHFYGRPAELAKEGDAWFTVMGNVNAVAVAALADCACIVLCHGAALDAVAKTRAEEQGINIFTTDLPEFEAGFALARAMKL